VKLVEFLPDAKIELREHALWYDERVEGLGDRLHEAVSNAAAIISDHPEIGAPHILGTRKWRVKVFPFNLIYLNEPERLIIVAVAHGAREPGYWRKRITTDLSSDFQ
jgi:toxin ParE1/3/4